MKEEAFETVHCIICKKKMLRRKKKSHAKRIPSGKYAMGRVTCSRECSIKHSKLQREEKRI